MGIRDNYIQISIGGALVLLIVSFIIHKGTISDSATRCLGYRFQQHRLAVLSPQNYTQDHGETKGLLDTLTGELKII